MTTALHDGDDRLTPSTSYEVHVRAKTAERNSEWSAVATGRTSAGNQEPVFDDRPDQEDGGDSTASIDRIVNENTRAGQPVGGPVRARDRDTLTYDLVAAEGTGQALETISTSSKSTSRPGRS